MVEDETMAAAETNDHFLTEGRFLKGLTLCVSFGKDYIRKANQTRYMNRTVGTGSGYLVEGVVLLGSVFEEDCETTADNQSPSFKESCKWTYGDER